MDNYEFLLAKREEFARVPLIPARLLGGDDLVARGWRGPSVGRLLTAVQTLQLEGKLSTRAEALVWLETCRRADVDGGGE
jgi:hypothetical protein